MRGIFLRELKKDFLGPVFVLFFLAVALFAFQDSANDVVGRTNINEFGKAWHNAPLFISKQFAFLSFVTTLFTIIIAGRSVAKDFQSNIHTFFFTAPISKGEYLFGRYLAALLVCIVALAGIAAGSVLGCLSIASNFSGPFHVWPYLFSLITFGAPSILLISSLFFTMATLSRNMFTTYIVGVALIVLLGVVSGGTIRPETEYIRALLDPTGLSYLKYVTADWTVAEINSRSIPIENIFFLNRALYLLFSAACLYFCWLRFKLVGAPESKSKKKGLRRKSDSVTAANDMPAPVMARVRSGFFVRAVQLMHLVRRDSARIIRHPAFLILLALTLRQIYVNFTANVGPNGSNVYALTSWYLRFLADTYEFVVPVTIFFGGMLVMRERDNNTDPFYDALPLPLWTRYLSKLLILVSIYIFYVVCVFGLGAVSQILIFNFKQIDLALYAQRLLGIELITYIHVAVLVLFIHALSNNKYLGFGLCALFYAADIIIFDVNGWNQNLLHYGFLPGYSYSNLNGFGNFTATLIAYRIYWLFPALILGIITVLIWPYGKETSLGIRLNMAWKRITRKTVLALTALSVLTVGVGAYIYYNEYVLNIAVSPDELLDQKANYEKAFKVFETSPMPSMTGITLNVDIYPYDRWCRIQGKYTLKNRTNMPIDTILVQLTDRYVTRLKELDLKGAKVVSSDAETGVRLFQLNRSLLPGNEMQLAFEYVVEANGFSSHNAKRMLTSNGSCITNILGGTATWFPLIGYSRHYEIDDPATRDEYDLPERERYVSIDDSLYGSTAVSDLIDYDAVIGTAGDQQVVTNGSLLCEWVESGRKYVHYASDTVIASAITIVTGKYEEEHEAFDDKDIAVYYDSEHSYNIPSMFKGMKAALDYCTTNFGPYPYRSMRIVEVNTASYPGSGTAMSLPTIFGWQERGGFISNLEDTAAMNVVFNTTTHEVAHQWWGSMIRPATVEGSGILTEGIAQWVRAKCLENAYGAAKLQEYLSEQSIYYLRWRQRDNVGERPLYKAAGQGYLLYGKSAVVMYALGEYLTEDSVNAALRSIAKKHSLNDDNGYPTTIDLIEALYAVSPDSLHYFIDDCLKKIVLYDNKVLGVEISSVPDGFLLQVEVEGKKLESDPMGAETEIEMHDYIPIRITDRSGNILRDEMVLMNSGHNIYNFKLNTDNAVFQIDPKEILFQRKRDKTMLTTDGSTS